MDNREKGEEEEESDGDYVEQYTLCFLHLSMHA